MNESPSAWHLQHQPFSWAWPSASSPIYNTIWVCCSRFLGSAGQCARLKSEIRALLSLASHFSLGFAGSGSLTFIYNRPSRLHMYTSIKTPATSSTSSSVCTIFVKESPESFQNPLLQKSQPDRFIILNIVTECRYWCLQPGAPVHPHPDDSSGICHPAKASYIRTIPKACKIGKNPPSSKRVSIRRLSSTGTEPTGFPTVLQVHQQSSVQSDDISGSFLHGVEALQEIELDEQGHLVLVVPGHRGSQHDHPIK